MNTDKTSLENQSQPSCLGAVMCRFYIKFRKCSSTTNENGRWWIALDYAWCKKRGSIVVLRGKIGNGDTGDRACR